MVLGTILGICAYFCWDIQKRNRQQALVDAKKVADELARRRRAIELLEIQRAIRARAKSPKPPASLEAGVSSSSIKESL
jgi:hypothetical protein